VKHTCSAIRYLVKDYWDVGAMLLAGFAFNDTGNKIFGDARFPVTIVSGIAGLKAAENDMNRMSRNFYAGATSLFGFWTRGIDVPVSAEIAYYGCAALMGAGSVYMDSVRRQHRPENFKPPSI
jgi:hypothetical protein